MRYFFMSCQPAFLLFILFFLGCSGKNTDPSQAQAQAQAQANGPGHENTLSKQNQRLSTTSAQSSFSLGSTNPTWKKDYLMAAGQVVGEVSATGPTCPSCSTLENHAPVISLGQFSDHSIL